MNNARLAALYAAYFNGAAALENDWLYGGRKLGDPVPRGLLAAASATVQNREEARGDAIKRERAAWNAEVDRRKTVKRARRT